MSSKGYIRIPESQLRIERSKRLKNRKWHNNIMNLLLRKNVCGACLRIENDIVHWDVEFVVVRCENENESSLKNIMISTFGPSVTSIIPTPNFCQQCVDTILSAHVLILQLRENCKNIQKKLIEISQQMKWTAYLDETGSLTETILNNKAIQEDYNLNTDCNETDDLVNVNNSIEKEMKTHKIILDNESLKNKLIRDANMHKYLFNKVTETEPTLPAGITVKKVVKDIDMTDFAPQDLLELNWAEDEEERGPSSKLQSNEALIMNLMEEARTVEKDKHFHDNLNLKVKEPEVQQTLHDSLSVKLIHSQTVTENDENYSDTDDLVPQDLLELKWPDEPKPSDMQQTKIPVMKLNFNEALTVKFIPAHKLVRVNDGAKVTHELLENSNETETQTKKDAQKHNIDLTKWLHDQGMNTINAKSSPENSTIQDFDIEAHISKKVKLEKKDTPEEYKFSGSGLKANKCNIAVKNLDVLRDSDNTGNAIKCGLCDLSFVLFESYQSHYKTHTISDTAKCYKCTGKFPVVELLIEHLLIVHSEDMAYCTLCYALLSQSKLAQHMIDHHAKKVEVINAATVPLITKDGRCKTCNQTSIVPNIPHICVFNYECTECKEDCIHERFIKSYIEQIKDNKAVYKCTDCEYMYKTKQDIIKHANYMHLRHMSHQCVVCKMKFATQNELSKHNVSTHFTCKRCKKVFSEKNLNHDCHIKNDNMICEACGQRFNHQKLYHKHKETALAIRDQCILCHDFVPNVCNLSRHMQVKHQVYLKKVNETIFYECTICQQKFDDGINFRQHRCLYDCNICERRFINKILYERHLQAHMGVKPQLKCCVCNLQMRDKYAFSNHMATHTHHGKCPICLTYFKRNILKKHIESHESLETNSLKCPHCVLVCENRNQYEVHVNRFHLMRRPYQCDICSKAFYGKLRLREHIKEHASHRRRIKCPVCEKRFARKPTMERHLKLHSSGQLYNCDLCEKMYISAALLEQHRKCHTDNPQSKPETAQGSQM
ncbi:zinc finger protein 808-like [Cydia pomonella]|uniref:zinc finger protein 808-like n=1 Tax=Cydia pomonella TaxID=82600 RepID=UPI002ADE7073|nr:zinc finger protein 808-like [Cydia pomonella]